MALGHYHREANGIGMKVVAYSDDGFGSEEDARDDGERALREGEWKSQASRRANRAAAASSHPLTCCRGINRATLTHRLASPAEVTA